MEGPMIGAGSLMLGPHSLRSYTSEGRQAVLFVLAGEGEARCESRLYDIEAGQVLLVPAGKTLAIASGGPSGLQLADAWCQYGVMDMLMPDFTTAAMADALLSEEGEVRVITPEDTHFAHMCANHRYMEAELSAGQMFAVRIAGEHFTGMLLVALREVYSTLEHEDVAIAARVSLVGRVCYALHTRYSEPLTLESVAREQRVSPQYLSAQFKKQVGKGFAVYLSDVRVEHAKLLLTDSDDLVVQIAEAVGFANSAYFGAVFRKSTGLAPLAWRKLHRRRNY